MVSYRILAGYDDEKKLKDAQVNADHEVRVNFTDNLDTVSKDYSTGPSAASLITPAPGKRLEIHECFATTTTKTTDITIEFQKSQIVVAKWYTDDVQGGNTGTLHVRGAVGEPLAVTGGDSTFISVTYREVEAVDRKRTPGQPG
jgi:hypothetical protein